MILRRSSFVHLLPLGEASVLAIHAVTQSRLPLTAEMAGLIGCFDQAVALEGALPRLATQFAVDEPTLRACVAMLLDRGLLTGQSAEAEAAAIAATLRGRDPAAALDRYRRASFEGSHPYWAVEAPQGLQEALGLSAAGWTCYCSAIATCRWRPIFCGGKR